MITVWVDGSGVWSRDGEGRPFGYEWSEVFEVVASSIDCVTEVERVLEFVTDYGHALELNSSFAGFEQVAAQLHVHLPGAPANLLEEMRGMASEGASTIWSRRLSVR